jgi:hypothetical protein
MLTTHRLVGKFVSRNALIPNKRFRYAVVPEAHEELIIRPAQDCYNFVTTMLKSCNIVAEAGVQNGH